MKKKREKSGISIYKKLIFSYVLFALIIIMIFVVCILGVSMARTGGSFDNEDLYIITTGKECQSRLATITGFAGWVEQLDESYRVVEVYGEKKTAEMGYSQDQLYDLISGHQAGQTEYVGFINENKEDSGYYLIQYYRQDIELNPAIMYSPENSDSTWNTVFVLLFIVLFAGACVLLGSYLSSRIRRPLRTLSNAMNQVKAGEASVLLDFKAEAEFAEIRDAFNIMTRSLEEARQQKEEAEAKKNKMLLELSHDIKTPISTIRSFAVALEQDMVKEEDKPGYYNTIHLKAVRITSLADDMFTMLKMRSGDYQLQKKQEDICEFLRKQCAEYYYDALEKGLQMTVDIPETEISCAADYTLLTRVVGNLLSNAVKYNQTGKSIEVKIKKIQDRIKIWVSDDGEPIADEIRLTLFDDFIRGDRARKSDGGTGLGLSITKAVVEKHGGDIYYEYANEMNHFIIVL